MCLRKNAQNRHISQTLSTRQFPIFVLECFFFLQNLTDKSLCKLPFRLCITISDAY